MLEKAACIKLRGVADITTLCIGDDELIGILLADIPQSEFKSVPALHPEALVKSEVRLVGYAVGRGSVDNSAVELEDGVFGAEQMLRDLLYICVESDAQHRAFATDVFGKLSAVHICFFSGLEK